MSEEKTRLRIHSKLAPEIPMEEKKAPIKTVRWRSIPHPKQKKEKPPMTFTDRLLKNSALACALLLAILAMGNINQPWARSASESVERALTMHIDLDESIGGLSFVKKIMPESALVFLNLTGRHELDAPVDGSLTHGFSDAQPWLLFDCDADDPVRAIADGTLTAVSELAGGAFGILIDHGSGQESVYAYLAGAAVQPGDTVQRGDPIGTSAENLYFELREGGASVDPAARMGL